MKSCKSSPKCLLGCRCRTLKMGMLRVMADTGGQCQDFTGLKALQYTMEFAWPACLESHVIGYSGYISWLLSHSVSSTSWVFVCLFSWLVGFFFLRQNFPVLLWILSCNSLCWPGCLWIHWDPPKSASQCWD